MKPIKLTKVAVAAAAALTVAATVTPPPANAMMNLGNYDVLTNRYDRSSWVWFIARCVPERSLDCIYVSAIPRRAFYAPYEGKAHLVGNTYTLVIDDPTGLQCFGQALPSHDTYTWDQNTLAGEINSTYDVGCFNGPPGTQYWTFALQRL